MSKSQKDRPRLGRGLSSLISVGASVPITAEVDQPAFEPDSADGSQPKPNSRSVPPASKNVTPSSPFEIPLAAIVPNPHQPRKHFSESSLTDLAASLRSNGLIQPIIVRQTPEGYQLIAGERRWRAAKLAGLTSVPAIVREVDGFSQAQMALVENIQREDLNPMDRAQAYRSLLEQLGLTQAELATRLGEDRSSIANHLRLLELAGTVRDQVAIGAISLGHAKVIASVADHAEQERFAKLIVAQGLSVRNLERIIANGGTATQERSPSSASAHLLDVEKSVARQLGMRVQLRSTTSKGKGRLVIHYASLDQFDDLMQRLNVKLD